MSENLTWRYKTWGGSTCEVTATTIEFTPTHVVWRDSYKNVVLAERPENVNQLTQVGHHGTADRYLRPKSDAR